MLIPLILHTHIEGLLLFDGSMTSVVVPDAPIAVQVLPDSCHHACLLPFDGSYMPAAARLSLQGNRLTDGECVNWPDCIEYTFSPAPLPVFTPAQILDMWESEDVRACLFREYGIHLSLERKGMPFFSRTVAQSGGGQLYACGSSVLAMTEQGALCVDTAGNVLLDVKGNCTFADGELLCAEQLDPFGLHNRMNTYDPSTGKLLRTFVERSRTPATEKECVLALLEAVRLGLSDEISGLLGGELCGLSLEDLREFFGNWDISLPHPFRSDVFGLFSRENKNARAFRFDTDDAGERVRVVNAGSL